MRIPYVILFCFLSFTLSAQNPVIDSLQNQLSQVEGKEKVDVLNALLEVHLCQDDSIATFYFRESITLLSQLDYPYGKIISYKHYGTMMYCQGKLDSIRHYQRLGAQIGDEFGFHGLAGRLFSNLGFLFNISANYDSSKYYFGKALDISLVTKDTALMTIAYTGLGIITQQHGLVSASLQMYLKGLTIAEASKDTLGLITAQLNLIAFYSDYRKDLLKMEDVEQVLQLTRQVKARAQEISALEHLGYMLANEGKFDAAIGTFEEGLNVNSSNGDITRDILLYQGISYAYHKSKNFMLSIQYINQAIDLSESSGFTEYLPSLYRDAVKNFIEVKKYDQVIVYGLNGITAGKESGKIEFYYEIYPELALAYAALEQHKKAYQAQVEYSRLNEELLGIKKSQQLADMQTKYETEKKEIEIASLSQQAAIQTLKLSQKNQTIMIGLVAFLFVLAVVYFMYNQRAIKNQRAQSELEQRFLRSQLNPHFISNALVAVQNFMLKNDAPSAALYLAKFSKLMREILENSRKDFIPFEQEISMLTNYLDIHKLRLATFEYTIDVDSSIDPLMDTIPPMFVQPFVENAIEHGIVNLENGRIDLKFEKDGDYIAIYVNDNGKGIVAKPHVDHTSLSTTIIRERMDVFNKSLKRKIELVMGNLPESGGMSVQLKVPFE